jgi:anaerobic selenocysteine-containing dehydrogenase
VADEHLSPLPGSDAALAIGMMRAVVDVGLQDEEWCREHADGYEELLSQLAEHSVERCAELCGVAAGDIERIAREFVSVRPALLRLGVGAQRHMGAPAAYSTIASLPALTGAWRDRGGGCSYIPTATASAISSKPLEREDLRPGPVRTINMSQVGQALTEARASGQGTRLLELQPRRHRPRPGAGARGSAPRRSLCGGARAVHDRHRRPRRRRAAGDYPARAPRRAFSWGHHYVTWNEPAIEPVGEAKPNTEVFRLMAQRLGFDDPCFAETDQQLVDTLLEGFP